VKKKGGKMRKLTSKQKRASKRNWNKKRIICMKGNADSLTESDQITEGEKSVLHSIITELDFLLKTWETKSLLLTLKEKK